VHHASQLHWNIHSLRKDHQTKWIAKVMRTINSTVFATRSHLRGSVISNGWCRAKLVREKYLILGHGIVVDCFKTIFDYSLLYIIYFQ
jgi:hypothetical protein